MKSYVKVNAWDCEFMSGLHEFRSEVISVQESITTIGPIVYNFLRAADDGSKTTNLTVILGVITLAGLDDSRVVNL
jgi:hypothetical protein